VPARTTDTRTGHCAAPGAEHRPVVFGREFLFSNCRQLTPALSPSRMQRLAPGSVILFGSTVSARSVLDTVFVVASGQRYVIGEPDAFGGTVPEVFRTVTLDALGGTGKLAGTSARLYRGAMHGAGSDDPHSFVPSRADGEPFARAAITLPGYINPRSTDSVRSTVVTAHQAREAWQHVVSQVRGQGLDLAVSLAAPHS
jgi:hypothetical protein